MPNTISVSPAQPDKLVVNGCDLVNRFQLSESQNRELQRYIDQNAHLLGFLDKQKEENEPVDESKYRSSKVTSMSGSGGAYSPSSYTTSTSLGGGVGGMGGGVGGMGGGVGSQSLNRVHSPTASEYSRRKGKVSFSDALDPNAQRARSHSPGNDYSTASSVPPLTPYAYSKAIPQQYATSSPAAASINVGGTKLNGGPAARPYSPAYSTSDKRRTPFDYDQSSLNRRGESPWRDTSSVWSHDSRESGKKKEDWRGFPVSDITPYSSLERHPDDYNRYDTHRHREQQLREIRDRDDSKKFYGYGDHKVSGIELAPRRWTGGEIITDPTFIKKSLKPRRLFYSPIGDGVVEADGVELKRGPPDLAPRIYVKHEKYMEKGTGGRTGRKILEETWSEGGGGFGDDSDAGRRGPYKNGGDDDGRGGPQKGGGLGDNGDVKGRGKPLSGLGGQGDDTPKANYQSPLSTLPRGASAFGDDGTLPRSGRTSAMSNGTDGSRAGWTKKFIINPRELINQYGTETQTIIFDLDDHTPKTTTTIKETITSSPGTPAPSH